jgi:hypothetical protein
MKKLAILGPLGLLVVSSAHAQTNPFSVRVGYSYLTNSSASDLGKQSGYLVGLGYDFFEFKKDRIKLTLDVDWEDHDGNGNKIETGTAFIDARVPFSKGMGMGMKSPEFYWGVGAGVVRSLVSYGTSTNTGSSIISSTNSSTTYNGGAEILLGARITKMFSAEFYYKFLESNSGVQPSTAGIVFSAHF